MPTAVRKIVNFTERTAAFQMRKGKAGSLFNTLSPSGYCTYRQV
jgi:hypothetical protein